MSVWLNHPNTLPMQCQQAFPDAYTIIQIACWKNRGRNSSKNYFSGTVWQHLELISNNILMAFSMVNFHQEMFYPFKIKWIKSSFTIEWE